MTELFHADQDAPQLALTFQKQPLNDDIAAAMGDASPGILIAGAILGGVFWVIAMVMMFPFLAKEGLLILGVALMSAVAAVVAGMVLALFSSLVSMIIILIVDWSLGGILRVRTALAFFSAIGAVLFSSEAIVQASNMLAGAVTETDVASALQSIWENRIGALFLLLTVPVKVMILFQIAVLRWFKRVRKARAVNTSFGWEPFNLKQMFVFTAWCALGACLMTSGDLRLTISLILAISLVFMFVVVDGLVAWSQSKRQLKTVDQRPFG